MHYAWTKGEWLIVAIRWDVLFDAIITLCVLLEDRLQHGMSTLIGYWTQGTPEAITIDAEMAGVDPIYGFPRVCDNTPVSAMFTMIPLDSNVSIKFSNYSHKYFDEILLKTL